MCSQFGDNLRTDKPEWAAVADECATMIAELAGTDLHYYPPGKPVIDQGQDSENSSTTKSGGYNLTNAQWADF
jgi:hypothetical protein